MAFLRFWKRRATDEATPAQRANPDRIAVLENELLGITPEPGTREAMAVARSQPVDQLACPHDDVIDVSAFAEPRALGICGDCGAHMVMSDEGTWHRP